MLRSLELLAARGLRGDAGRRPAPTAGCGRRTWWRRCGPTPRCARSCWSTTSSARSSRWPRSRAGLRAAGARAQLHCDAVQAAGLLPSTCAPWASTPWRSRPTSCTVPGGRAPSGCGRARGWRPCGTVAARSAACARGPRTCPRWSGFARAAALARAGPRGQPPRSPGRRDRLEREIAAPPARGAAHGARGHAPRAPHRQRAAARAAGRADPARARGARGPRLGRVGLRDPHAAGPATCCRRSACARTRRCCASRSPAPPPTRRWWRRPRALARGGRARWRPWPRPSRAAPRRGQRPMSDPHHPLPLRRAVPEAGQPPALRAAAARRTCGPPWPACPGSP